VTDLSDRLPLANKVSDACLRPEDPVDRRVNIAVTSMTADLSRFTRQGKRTTVRDDNAQSIPTGLHDDVGMVPGDKARAEPHGEVRESTLDVGLLVLTHPSIDEDLWTKAGEKSFDVADIYGNGTVIAESFLDSRKIVGAHGMHALEDCGPVENRIGEGHPAPCRRWRRSVLDDHRIPFNEQSMRDR